jgi:hypothetical protein
MRAHQKLNRKIIGAIAIDSVASLAAIQPAFAITYDKYRATPSTDTAKIGETITITGKTAAKSMIPGEKAYPGPGDTLCTYLYVKKVPSSYRMTLTDSETGKTTSTKWPGGPGWLQLDNCTKVQANRTFTTTLVLGTAGLGKKTYAMGDGSDDNVGVYMLPENVAASNKFDITGTN